MPQRRITELRHGDLCDLEGDKYADPYRNHLKYRDSYVPVLDVERETDSCFCVHFEDGDAVGFPPDHEIECARRNRSL
jgi:hypothetical protein